MSALSDYLENALINHVLRNIAFASPTTVYCALYTAAPTDADTGTEVTGGAYARQAVTFGAPTDGLVKNSAEVIFPVATANWGTITHFGIRNALTVGNLLFHGALTTSKTVNNGDQLKFSVNDLQCSLA